MEVEWHDGGEWRYQHHASTHHTASEEQGIPNMPSLTLQQTALSDSDRTGKPLCSVLLSAALRVWACAVPVCQTPIHLPSLARPWSVQT